METTDHRYLHAFRYIEGIGNSTLEKLLAHFGESERAWHASESELAAVPRLGPHKTARLVSSRRHLNPNKLWEQLLELGITVHGKNDPTYPALLREIPDAPQTLYTRGNFDWTESRPMVAIVGSRKHSAYGVQVAEQLSADLARFGITVVSGMAFGIDSAAHSGTLAAEGTTIAVLGSGIDDPMISPVSHFHLAKKIMQHGALVSEYPPGTEANQGSFPQRDRIIAGLCLGTIVIEAPEKSGSLITAQCALEYNREVFAIPGSIFSPYSIGTNALLKRGAKLVTGVSDIMEELQLHTLFPNKQIKTASTLPPGLSPEEQKICSLLTHEPLHVDKIIKQTSLETAKVSSLLSLLEIKGLAKNVGAMHYVRVA